MNSSLGLFIQSFDYRVTQVMRIDTLEQLGCGFAITSPLPQSVASNFRLCSSQSREF